MSPEASLTVRRMADGEEPAAGGALARALADDPIFVHVLVDRAARLAFLERFMTALARRSHRLAEALVTSPQLVGASLWKGPALRALTAEQLAMTGLDRIGDWLPPDALGRFDALFDAVDRALDEDAPEPAWYLGVVGVAPERQGLGLGSRLIAPLLERADRERLPVTLETAQPRNLPLYGRLGFEVLRELGAEATGGPTVWTMRRPPRG